MHVEAFGRSAPVAGWNWYCCFSSGMGTHEAFVTAGGHCLPPSPGKLVTSRHVAADALMIRPVVRSCVRSAAASASSEPQLASTAVPPLLPRQSFVDWSRSWPLGSFSHAARAFGASQGVDTTSSPAAGVPLPQAATAPPPGA